MIAFAALAVAGFKRKLWIVAAALAGHGVFDAVHGTPADKSRRPGMVAGVLSGIRRHGAVEAQCLPPVDVIVRVIEVCATELR
jgi:hypothetical protein